MLSFGLSALLFAANAAVAQPPAGGPPPVTPPPAFNQAAEAFGRCIQGAIGQAPATSTPESAAALAMATCAAQKAAIETQFDAWIASPQFPPEGREPARQQFRAQLGQTEAQIAAAIRQQRAAAPSGARPSN